MEIKARELVAPNFIDLFKAVLKHTFTEFCLVGGRGSTKSSFISIAIVCLIIMVPGVNALVLRKYSNTLRESVFEQLLWAIDKLGVNRYFRATVSPMRIVYIPTGQMIMFRGVDEPTKIKSIKMHSGYIGILWFEESTEFRPEEVRSVKQSTMRGGEKFWTFDSFNPPTNRNNWKNKDILIDKPNRLVHRSDFSTVPIDWLSRAFVDEAEWTKEHNFKLYQNEYLGECTGSGLDVFENVEDKPMTDDEIGKFDYYFHGIDWGYYPDPWAYCAMAYKPDTRELFIFDELKAYKKGNEKTSDLLLEHLQGGAWRWYNRSRPGSPAECAVKLAPDSAEPKSISDYRAYGWHCTEPVKTGLRDYGFKWLQSLTAIYIDKARAPETFAELTGYEYETDKNGEIISTYPEGQADHFIACIRYAMEEVYRRRGL
jgi:PBSX family phage terminase large subunit